MEETEWEKYGTGNYEKCANCMVHCGYEGTAVDDTFAHPLKALKVALRGPRTEGPMAPEIDLSKARKAEAFHEHHVLEAMSEVDLTKRDLRWFAEKGVDVPPPRQPAGGASAGAAE